MNDAYPWLIGILLAIVLEGALRKWVLPPDAHPLAYFGKDILAVLFLLTRPIPKTWKTARKLQGTLGLAALLVLPSFFFGLQASVPAAILTYKNVVIWPLFAIAIGVWINQRTIHALTRLLVVLCLANALLGWFQFSSSRSSTINQYAWKGTGYSVQDVANFGQIRAARATGSFSYISGMSTFGAVGFAWLVWQLLLARRRNERILYSVGAAAALLCIFESGSRAPMSLAILSLVGAVILFTKGKQRFRIVALCLFIGVVYSTFLETKVFVAYFQRVNRAGDDPFRRAIGTGFGFVELLAEYPFGIGMGQQSQVSNFRVTKVKYIEDNRSRIAIESGFPGIAAQFLTLVTLLQIMKMAWRRRSAGSRIGMAMFGLPGVYLLSNGLWFDHNASSLWWLAIGVWLAVIIQDQTGATDVAPPNYLQVMRQPASRLPVGAMARRRPTQSEQEFHP